MNIYRNIALIFTVKSPDISTYGVGRPWGTEIRQRLATAFGLKKEVNSLWELGLNSLANSQHVYLGEHFIGLIKQDPAMEKIREHITRKVTSDIRSRAYHVPYLTIQSFEGRISGMKPEEFGGKRSSDDMIQQLKFTLRPQSVLFQNMPTHGMLQ